MWSSDMKIQTSIFYMNIIIFIALIIIDTVCYYKKIKY